MHPHKNLSTLCLGSEVRWVVAGDMCAYSLDDAGQVVRPPSWFHKRPVNIAAYEVLPVRVTYNCGLGSKRSFLWGLHSSATERSCDGRVVGRHESTSMNQYHRESTPINSRRVCLLAHANRRTNGLLQFIDTYVYTDTTL
eukprot:COSAG01_NODE_14610_length_1432_cov_3.937734_1_plen_140_part_00